MDLRPSAKERKRERERERIFHIYLDYRWPLIWSNSASSDDALCTIGRSILSSPHAIVSSDLCNRGEFFHRQLYLWTHQAYLYSIPCWRQNSISYSNAMYVCSSIHGDIWWPFHASRNELFDSWLLCSSVYTRCSHSFHIRMKKGVG